MPALFLGADTPESQGCVPDRTAYPGLDLWGRTDGQTVSKPHGKRGKPLQRQGGVDDQEFAGRDALAGRRQRHEEGSDHGRVACPRRAKSSEPEGWRTCPGASSQVIPPPALLGSVARSIWAR
jgi:hypothetical protein